MKKTKALFLILCVVCILLLSFTIFALAQESPISFTDTDQDHIYFAGDNISFSFDTTNYGPLPANTPVVAELYLMTPDQEHPENLVPARAAVLAKCNALTSRIACDTTTANTIKVNGTIANANTLLPAVVGVKFYINGTVESELNGDALMPSAIPVGDNSNKVAFVGLDNVLPSNVTTLPVWNQIPNFFDAELDITFIKDLGSENIGKIAFTDLGFTSLEDMKALAHLENSLNIYQDNSPDEGSDAQFGFAIDGSKLSLLASNITANISLTSKALFDGKTAADFTAINGDTNANAVVSFDDQTDTASFAVTHFSEWTLSLAEESGGFMPPTEHFMGHVSFNKTDNAGMPNPAPFVIGSLPTFDPIPKFTPDEDIDFLGLFVEESDYDFYSYSGFYSSEINVHLSFPTPSAIGETYTVQYSSNGTDGWANYQEDGNDVVTDPTKQTVGFGISPSSAYYYRLISNTGKLSNVVFAEPSTRATDFITSGGMDSSMFITGTMSPYVGYGIEVTCPNVKRVENNSLVDVAIQEGYITYEWYRVNPVTDEMTKINGETSNLYVTTAADVGYEIVCRMVGDGSHIGGYTQIRSKTIVTAPVKGYVSNVTDTGFTLNLERSTQLALGDLELFDSAINQEITITALTEVGEGAEDNAVYNVSADLSAVAASTDLYLSSKVENLSIGAAFSHDAPPSTETEPGLVGNVSKAAPAVTMLTETNGDQIYNAGDAISFTLSLNGIDGIASGDTVRVAIGRLGDLGRIYRFRQLNDQIFSPLNPFATTPLLEVDSATESYYYRTVQVPEGGLVTITDTLAAGITPASVGIVILNADGSEILSNMAVLSYDKNNTPENYDDDKQIYFGVENALQGGMVYAEPFLKNLTDLYAIPDISFNTVLVDNTTGDDIVGSISFKNLNLIDNWNELMQLSSALILKPINASDPTQGFEIGMDAEKLANLSLKPATISVSGLNSIDPALTVDDFDISTKGSGKFEHIAYNEGTLSFDVTKFSTYEIKFAEAEEPQLTVTVNGTDADNVYFGGQALSYTISGLDAYNAQNLYVVTGAIDGTVTGGETLLDEQLLSSSYYGNGYWYNQATVADGAVTISSDVVEGWDPAKVVIQLRATDGTVLTAPIQLMTGSFYVDDGFPVNPQSLEGVHPVKVGLENGIEASITCTPALNTIENLYNVPSITLQKTITGSVIGKITFTNVDFATHEDELLLFLSGIKMLPTNSGSLPEGMQAEFTMGVKTETGEGQLSALVNKPAKIEIAGLSTSLSADKFVITPEAGKDGAVQGSASFVGGVLAFDVNHFSDYKIGVYTADKIPLTITGLTSENKVYDGTTAATLSGTAVLDGVVGEDNVTLVTTGATANFADADAGVGKAVTVSGYSLSGTDAANYILVQPTGLTAAITQKQLTYTGLSAENKVYDGTTAATLTGNLSVSGKIGQDDVSITGNILASFDNKNVGLNKDVTVTGFTLSGEDKDNYWIITTAMILNADITAQELTIGNITANTKTYDGTITATLAGTAALVGKVVGDDVSLAGTPTAEFSSKDVGLNKDVTVTVYSLSGADKDNYTLTQPTMLKASINSKQLTVTGLTISNKVYDGSALASLSGTATLSGVVGTEDVTLSGIGTAAFADAAVGNGKLVEVSGYALSGADIANYTLSLPNFNADITAKELTIIGLTVADKEYDGTTQAILGGNPALSAVVDGDTVSLVSNAVTASFANKNAEDNKAVIINGYTLSGADSTNYTLTQPANITANITKKALTVTADNKTKAVGAANPDATISYNGFIEGENAANSGITPPIASHTAVLNSPAGEYDILLNGGSGGANYALTLVNGTLTIEAPVSSISPTTGSFDKKVAAQADIAVSMTLNGNSFYALKLGNDVIDAANYTVSGNTLTIKKAYLATLPLGENTLSFIFRDAANTESTKNLVITVSDTTTYVISVSAVPDATVTAETGSASPVAKGGSYAFTVNLPIKYDPATLVVKAGTNVLTATSGVYTITNIQADTLISVEANIKTFTVTGTVTGSGTINPATKQVSYGGNAVVSVLPNTGYEVSTFTVGGVDKKAQLINGTYTVSNITANTAVAVTFTAKQYSVTKTAGTGGSITANNTVAHGASLTVTITPENGKKVGSVSYTIGTTTKVPALVAGDGDAKTFTITNITGNVTINATFADVDKTALVNAIAAARLINPAPYQDTFKNAFNTALSNAVIVKDTASATTEQVNEATTALTDATGNLTDANKKTFSVTVANTVNGTASVDKTTVKYAENATLTITADANYELYKVLVNGVQINGTVIKNITANTTVTVIFRSTIPAAVTQFKANHSVILAKTVATVQLADGAVVNSALTAYNNLDIGEKNYLANEYQLLQSMYWHLENLQEANAVSLLIINLNNDGSMAYVDEVRYVKAKYDALAPEKKKLIPLAVVNGLRVHILSANEIYNNNLAEQARINHVNDLVDSLLVTIGGGGYANISAATATYLPAKQAYDSLTQEQQLQVTNRGRLTQLESAILQANQTAATTVTNLINALTVVTEDMDFDTAEGYKKAIIEAKNAYDALTEDQKELISSAVITKLYECFDSVAIVIEKPMPDDVDDSLAGGISFTGISDTIDDFDVDTPDDYEGTESDINETLNGSGSDTAMRAELILDFTPRNAGGGEQQPEGKIKIRILLGDALRNMRAFLSVVYSHNGGIYSLPCNIVEINCEYYIEFEADRFSTYAVVSEVHSGNSYLSALSASGVTLNPAFDKDTLSYTASVANSVTSTTISATAEDNEATVSGTGSKNLAVGSNVFSIVVTADDNSTKTYTMNITRAAATTSGGGNKTVTTPEEDVINSNAGNVTTSTVNVALQTNATTGKASAVVDNALMQQALAEAKTAETAKQNAVIAINAAVTGTTKAIDVEIPRDSLNSMVEETKAALQVKAGIGTVTFNADALEAINDNADNGNVLISINKLTASELSSAVQEKVGNRPVYRFGVQAGSAQVSQFGTGFAEVSLPYSLQAGEDKDAIVVYYVDQNGNLETMRGRYDTATGNVVFKTAHFSNFAIGYNKVTFTDVTSSMWYSDAVDFIAARGIATGTGENKYSPAAKLTRGQFIVMLMRAYGIEAEANPATNFADAGNTYYTNYLAAAKRLGITNGVGNNLYAPNQECTRQEMFTLVYNALNAIGELPEATDGKALTSFTDNAKVASWAREALNYLTTSGTIGGVSGNQIDPLSVSTRGQMAQVLYNLLTK